MLLLVLDILMTIYQGGLLVYTMRKQFFQSNHSLNYELGTVTLYVIYIFVIQHLHLPLPDSLSIVFLYIYIMLTSEERFLTCLLWTLLDGLLFFGTLTLISSLFTIQIDMNGSVISSDEETQIIYYFVGNAAITVILNIAARLSRPDHLISVNETIIFIFMLLINFGINECFFMARLFGHTENILVIGSACSFVLMVLTMILYDRMAVTVKKLWRSELSAQTSQKVIEHQEELKSIYRNMLAQQHDIHHRITAAEKILSLSLNDDSNIKDIFLLLKESTPVCM